MLRTPPPVRLGLQRKGILRSGVAAEGIKSNTGNVACSRGSPRRLGGRGAWLWAVLAGVGGSVGGVGGIGGIGSGCVVGAIGRSLFVVLLRGVGKVCGDQGVGEGV